MKYIVGNHRLKLYLKNIIWQTGSKKMTTREQDAMRFDTNEEASMYITNYTDVITVSN